MEELESTGEVMGSEETCEGEEGGVGVLYCSALRAISCFLNLGGFLALNAVLVA